MSSFFVSLNLASSSLPEAGRSTTCPGVGSFGAGPEVAGVFCSGGGGLWTFWSCLLSASLSEDPGYFFVLIDGAGLLVRLGLGVGPGAVVVVAHCCAVVVVVIVLFY